jgi:hypothetical protein
MSRVSAGYVLPAILHLSLANVKRFSPQNKEIFQADVLAKAWNK